MSIPTTDHTLTTLLDGAVQVTLTRAAVADLIGALSRSLARDNGEVTVVLDVCESRAWFDVHGVGGGRIGGPVTYCYAVINN